MLVALISLTLSAGPVAGTYILEGGYGTLVLAPKTFTINSVGGNAHTCELEGTWSGEKALATGDLGPEDACPIKLEKTSEGVRVTPLDDEKCRVWCGVRATFNGHYLTPPKGCGAAEVKTARDGFKKAYDAKKYPEALALLTPVLSSCGKVLDRFEVLWIRNDLAIAQHHAGDDAACLKTLEPTGDLRFLSDEDAAGGEPAFEEILKRLGKATRTNAKRCGFVEPKK